MTAKAYLHAGPRVKRRWAAAEPSSRPSAGKSGSRNGVCYERGVG